MRMKSVYRRNRIAAVLIAAAAVLFVIRLLPERDRPAVLELGGGTTFVIDAGHGGIDGGACGRAGTVEKDVNLAIALNLRDWCDFFGIRYVLTRDSDMSLHSDNAKTIHAQKAEDLKKRLEITNAQTDPIYIGIHQNFFDDYTSHGAQVFWSKNSPDGKVLAEIIQQSLAKSLGEYGKRSAAAGPGTVYLMKNLKCPAVIVECGFLSHPAEEELLVTPEWQNKIASGVAYAMLTCLTAAE